ncbi:MAG: hypothetical protein Q4F60_02490, partial [Candidatus Saccharibacteria bacterium]|nr:hypothetical protein [Candidatus Saccharibacteria bacterium]
DYYGLGWGREYLPVKTTRPVPGINTNLPLLTMRSSDPIVISGSATISDVKSRTPYLSFSVSELTSDITIELPRLYYLGYKITTKSGENIPYVESPNGFVQIKISSPETITVEYTNTNLVKLSRFLAFATSLYLGYLIVLKNKPIKNQD